MVYSKEINVCNLIFAKSDMIKLSETTFHFKDRCKTHLLFVTVILSLFSVIQNETSWGNVGIILDIIGRIGQRLIQVRSRSICYNYKL